MEEIERKIESLRNQKGVKIIYIMNSEGEIVTTVVNPGSGLDDEDIEKLHLFAYHLMTGARSAIKQFDSTELLQFMRVRMKEYEVLIVPEDKFNMVVVQDPGSS